jgi:hypothetical protein
MTLGELKVIIDTEIARRKASEMSEVRIELDCGDVGHSLEVIGVSDIYRSAFALQAAPVDCCVTLHSWNAEAAEDLAERSRLSAAGAAKPAASPHDELVAAVRAGLPRYLQNGCSNCGAIPHTFTCMVGELQKIINTIDAMGQLHPDCGRTNR